MTEDYKSIETKLVHAGEPVPRMDGAVSLPIFQSSTFETFGGEGYHDIRYIRLNNTPNHVALATKMAALENAEDALVTASGMAAISTALLAVLSAGDHILIQNCLYGGTHDLVLKDLPRLGIEHDLVDADDPGSWETKLRPGTRVFYVESIANPLMTVGDLKAVVDFARAHNLITMIDNTFASPINFRPAELGFDLSLHSCTKYMNGHSDIVAGAVIGRGDLVKATKFKTDHLGGTLDPHACFLLHRGLKTLALRVRCQNDNAQKIAEFLDSHTAVASVNYPGLENHPQHERARELFDGFGGMLSFELKGDLDDVNRFMRSVRIPLIAPSLGGVESLLTRPAVTSHAGLSGDELKRSGISDTLVRMSVGIEAADDLISDLGQALAA
ncbi:MAG: aminotransferase class I/II-fold pyridoxal phosphate-dependent enzyme [Candidatus Krumholzibacteria bacterium]